MKHLIKIFTCYGRFLSRRALLCISALSAQRRRRSDLHTHHCSRFHATYSGNHAVSARQLFVAIVYKKYKTRQQKLHAEIGSECISSQSVLLILFLLFYWNKRSLLDWVKKLQRSTWIKHVKNMDHRWWWLEKLRKNLSPMFQWSTLLPPPSIYCQNLFFLNQKLIN